MEDKKFDRNALTEVYTILNELNLYNKIPQEFQEFINENKNNDYIFEFDKNIPLSYQLKNNTTGILLSYIYLKYINASNKNSSFILKDVLEMLDIKE